MQELERERERENCKKNMYQYKKNLVFFCYVCIDDDYCNVIR